MDAKPDSGSAETDTASANAASPDAANPDPRLCIVHRRSDSTPDPLGDTDPLRWILGFPPEEVRFLDEIRGRRALLCRDVRHDRFRSLAPNDLLGEDARDGARDELPSHETQDASAADPVDEEHTPLGRLSAALSRRTGAVTWADVHRTAGHVPPGPPVWESHDTYVMQVDGSTRWFIYEGGEKLPVAPPPLSAAAYEPGSEVASLTLRPGETLYVPRGILHTSQGDGTPAVHIGLISLPYTWHHLLKDCLDHLAASDPTWREDLPYDFPQQATSGFPSIGAVLRARLDPLADELDPALVLASVLADLPSIDSGATGDR